MKQAYDLLTRINTSLRLLKATGLGSKPLPAALCRELEDLFNTHLTSTQLYEVEILEVPSTEFLPMTLGGNTSRPSRATRIVSRWFGREGPGSVRWTRLVDDPDGDWRVRFGCGRGNTTVSPPAFRAELDLPLLEMNAPNHIVTHARIT